MNSNEIRTWYIYWWLLLVSSKWPFSTQNLTKKLVFNFLRNSFPILSKCEIIPRLIWNSLNFVYRHSIHETNATQWATPPLKKNSLSSNLTQTGEDYSANNKKIKLTSTLFFVKQFLLFFSISFPPRNCWAAFKNSLSFELCLLLIFVRFSMGKI